MIERKGPPAHAKITEPLEERVMWIEVEDEETTIRALETDPIELEGEVVDLPTSPTLVPFPIVVGIAIGSSLFVMMIGVILYPLLLGTATVTITPEQKKVEDQVTITLPADQTLSSREKMVTLSGPATGKGHQDATYAHGIVIFYNASLSAQLVPAGTFLIGRSGMHLVTDEDVVVPAGNLATNGQASVQAHVTTIGASGNIAEADVSGLCCRENILTQNAAFWGGQDARDFQTVREEDVTGLAQQATLQAKELIIASFQHDIAMGESITPPQCQQQVSPSEPVGTEATQVSVSVTENCQAAAYTQTKLLPIAKRHFDQKVHTQLGKVYIPAKQIEMTIKDAQVKGSSILFALTVKGSATYHFSQEEKQAIRQAIAQKSQQQVILFLLRRKGVANIRVQVANNWGTLPANIGNITITTT